MAELIISSKDNRNVKLVRSLADKKGRRSSGLFLAEGVANIREALASDLQAEMLLYADGCQSRPVLADLLEQAEAKGAKLLALQPNLLAGLAQTEESQGLLLVLRQPACSTKAFAAAAAGRSVAVLDGLQDPGNVGTILRTAWAAGLGGVLLVNECADIFSPQVVRAALGAAATAELSASLRRCGRPGFSPVPMGCLSGVAAGPRGHRPFCFLARPGGAAGCHTNASRGGFSERGGGCRNIIF